MPTFIAIPAGDRTFISGRSVAGNSRWAGMRTSDWNLITVLEGDLTVSSDRESFLFNQGELLLIEPGGPRYFSRQGRVVTLWFHFEMQSGSETPVAWPEALPGFHRVVLPSREHRRATRTLLEIHQLDLHRRKGWYALAAALLESVIIRGNLAAEREERFDPRIELAQKLLADINCRLSIDEVAGRCGMGRTAFYKLFTEIVGVAPRRYREYHMLRLAQMMLDTSHTPLTRIAEQVGMPNVYYLSTRFKKAFGQSPSAYRERQKNALADRPNPFPLKPPPK